MPSITLLKSTHQQKLYAKPHHSSVISQRPSWPFLNDYIHKDLPRFQDLFPLMEKLLLQPRVTQILGHPTDDPPPAQPARRIKENFNFYHVQNQIPTVPVSYDYIILDIDHVPDALFPSLYRKEWAQSSLTPTAIQQLICALLQLTRRQLPPTIVRLSSSFGKDYAPDAPSFKGHVYLPLAQPATVHEIMAALTEWNAPYPDAPPFDTAIYRSPVQPVFTSAPVIYTAEDAPPSPLTTVPHFTPTLYRLHLFNMDSDARLSLPAAGTARTVGTVGTAGTSGTTGTAQNRKAPRPAAYTPSAHYKAHYLPGEKGVWNRAALRSRAYSIQHVLEKLRYTPANHDETRWLSPTSSSDSPGSVIYPDGFLFEHHTTPTPLQEMAPKSLQNRPLSAYDVHYIYHRAHNSLHQFRQILTTLTASDNEFQEYQYNELLTRLTFITTSTTPAELETIIQSIVEDTIHASLSTFRRAMLFRQIAEAIKSLNVPHLKITLSELNALYTSLKRKVYGQYKDVNPGNPVSANALALLDQLTVNALDPPPGYVISTPDGDGLEIVPSTETLKERLFSAVFDVTTDREGWSLSKLNSVVDTAVKLLNNPRILPRHCREAKPQQHLLALKPEPNQPRYAYDLQTHTIIPLTVNDCSAFTLPFTKQELDNAPDTIEGTFFEQFLNTSLPEQHRQEMARSLFSYVLSPSRKQQIIFLLIGVPRSGKSTLKNLLSALIPNELRLEMVADSFLRDSAALHSLTPYTRLLVMNEFNSLQFRPGDLDNLCNTLKALSGRDEITIRPLYTNPIRLVTDALPLLISNYMPHIPDDGLYRRLRVIKFDHGHDDSQSGVFQQRLMAELPIIFKWAVTYDLKEIPQEPVKADVQAIRLKSDPQAVFIETYIEPVDVKNKTDFIYSWQLRQMFFAFYKAHFERPPKDTVVERFGLRQLTRIYPQAWKARVIDKKDGTRHWVYKGVRWKDFTSMRTQLDPFLMDE